MKYIIWILESEKIITADDNIRYLNKDDIIKIDDNWYEVVSKDIRYDNSKFIVNVNEI